MLMEQRQWLGTQFIEVARRGLRRDITEAGGFFGMPQGQISYVIGSISRGQTETLCKIGLPYQVAGLGQLLEGRIEENLEQRGQVDPTSLEGWRREAFDHCVDHFWVLQSWAQRDLGLTALMGGLRKRSEAEAIASMSPRVLRKLAAATYGSFHIDHSMCMQMAMLFADADASPDRVAVARSGCKIISAAA